MITVVVIIPIIEDLMIMDAAELEIMVVIKINQIIIVTIQVANVIGIIIIITIATIIINGIISIITDHQVLTGA